MTLRTLNYGNYGIFLIMGNAGFCPSTVSTLPTTISLKHRQRQRIGVPQGKYPRVPEGLDLWTELVAFILGDVVGLRGFRI